jgi:hypothetical protein
MKQPPRDRPFFRSGAIAYEGHVCAPHSIFDLHGIVAGKFSTNGENTGPAIEMLQAAYEAGYEAGAKGQGE